MYKGLQDYISRLTLEGELAVVSRYTSPELEIPEITDRISKLPGGGRALLFTNNGTQFPLLINSMGSARRIALALGVKSLEEIGERMEEIMGKLAGPKKSLYEKLAVLPELAAVSSFFPHHSAGRGACQEFVMGKPDLGKLPVLKCWPGDGGRFITLPIVNTIHPVTRSRNAGMYRMQVFGPDTTGMHWHRHKTGARHYEAWKAAGKRMPVAVALGGDPVYTFAATAPLPEGIDEYLLAGFLRGKRVDLVKCLTQDIEVPSDADIVIEGYVDPSEPLVLEGPFGDHTGFYSLPDYYPLFHITCISWRKDAVYPATIVGIPPQEDEWIAKATERIFLKPVQLTLAPEVIDFNLPAFGVAHNLALVSIRKSFPGQAIKVANALWGAGQMMFTKLFVITGEDRNIHNYSELALYLVDNTDLNRALFYTRGPVDVLDHSSMQFSYGGKLCIDATPAWPEEQINGSTSGNLLPHKWEPGNIPGISLSTLIRGKKLQVFVVVINKDETSVAKAAGELAHSMPDGMQAVLLFVDHPFGNDQPDRLLWYVLNNMDPVRDVRLISLQKVVYIIVDGTRKSKKSDNFERNWPNVIVSDEETVRNIDESWHELGLGEFVPSPSDQFRYLVGNKGAEVVD
jgi:4-hydroxy-3-polyprenylbenzoate decarboxylase